MHWPKHFSRVKRHWQEPSNLERGIERYTDKTCTHTQKPKNKKTPLYFGELLE